jgi:hypothetical protein
MRWYELARPFTILNVFQMRRALPKAKTKHQASAPDTTQLQTDRIDTNLPISANTVTTSKGKGKASAPAIRYPLDTRSDSAMATSPNHQSSSVEMQDLPQIHAPSYENTNAMAKPPATYQRSAQHWPASLVPAPVPSAAEFEAWVISEDFSLWPLFPEPCCGPETQRDQIFTSAIECANNGQASGEQVIADSWSSMPQSQSVDPSGELPIVLEEMDWDYWDREIAKSGHNDG